MPGIKSSMKRKLVVSIKCLSIFLISSAIGLEVGNFYAMFTHSPLPPVLPRSLFWVERVAVAIHLIEGLIASVYAPRQHKAAIPYGVYTFFVGTVGLVELFALGQEGEGDRPSLSTCYNAVKT